MTVRRRFGSWNAMLEAAGLPLYQRPINVPTLEWLRGWTIEVASDLDSTCWIWQGTQNGRGYGRLTTFRDGRSAHVGAHTLSWELANQRARQAECHIHHRCGVTLCVNPDHLEEVTPKQHGGLSAKAQQTHCKRGHEFTPANTIVNSRGRQCRACKAAWARQQRARMNSVAPDAPAEQATS